MCSRNICFLQSQIRDKELQCTVLNVKPSGLSWLCLAPQLVTTFLSNSLKTLVTRTFTNGFPSVTSVLQHLVFNMFFHDVLFTAPSPLPGGDEKVILIFQRSPVNYSTGLCIAHPLHQGSPISDYKIFSSVQSSVVSDSLRPHESQIAARQASLSITDSRNSLRLTSIESVIPSSHFILCCPLLLLLPIPPSIRVSLGKHNLWNLYY